MASKKVQFIPSEPEHLRLTPQQEVCLKNARYLRQAADALEAYVLAGGEVPGYAARRIFNAAREAGMAVSGVQPPKVRGTT